MSEEIDKLKQIEKEKLADWQMEFATKSDVAQIKVEEESTQSGDHGQGWWPNWLVFMFIAFGLMAWFGVFNVGFSWWWFFIFLGPWMWGKGGRSRSCWW